MRELKFRAWNPVSKKFIYLRIGAFGEETAGISTIEHDCYLQTDGIIGQWEQYTGLKDKNGKEIYGGDIVDYCDDGECIGVVEYDAPEFYLNADATNWGRMFLKGVPYQRVIGNIHENGDILNDEQN